MAASKRQSILAAVKTRLDAITAGETYNTTPVIRDDQADAWNADEAVSIWCEMGDEEFEGLTFQAGTKVVCEINVNIMVRRSAGADLNSAANGALQDVRNALHANIDNWPTECGATIQTLLTCTTDEGILSHDGKILFTQPVAFLYAAGPTW